LHVAAIFMFVSLLVGSMWLLTLVTLRTADVDVEAILTPMEDSDVKALESQEPFACLNKPRVDYQCAGARLPRGSWLQCLMSMIAQIGAALIALSAAGAVCGAYLFGAGKAWGAPVAVISLLVLAIVLNSHRFVPELGGGPQEEMEYAGRALLPRKVYQGDSHTLSVRLTRIFAVPPIAGEPLRVYDVGGGRIVFVRFQRHGGLDQFLEIRLLGAGIRVEGRRTLRRLAKVRKLTYQWSCSFPHSGLHTLTLAMRLVTPNGAVELGTIDHVVRVVSLDHLTRRQVWAIGASLGLLSALLAVAEGLLRLRLW